MDIKDIKVGETYRFKSQGKGLLGLPEFNGGTARVVSIDDETLVFPVIANLANGTMRLNDANVSANELEVI